MFNKENTFRSKILIKSCIVHETYDQIQRLPYYTNSYYPNKQPDGIYIHDQISAKERDKTF